MAISGGTQATALAEARRLGIGLKDAFIAQNVASTTPTLTAVESATPGTVVYTWTNINGVRTLDIGDGSALRTIDPSLSTVTIVGVTAGTRVARIWGSGVNKKSASYVVTS